MTDKCGCFSQIRDFPDFVHLFVFSCFAFAFSDLFFFFALFFSDLFSFETDDNNQNKEVFPFLI